MLLSVANSRPRNVESIGVETLYPPALRESAQTLIEFIEHYYKYLNTTGLPSSEIANITREKDIDIVSNKYLTEIQSLIARSIPNSRAIDKVTLYRIIIQYYHTRGSEDSIHTFFKIFFNEIVDIFYPRNHIFDLSNGRGQWQSIVVESLNTVNTNPNKAFIEITSDVRIGNFPISDAGPYTVTLESVSNTLWTIDGKNKSNDSPYIEKTNISSNPSSPVYRWVYRYSDKFELYSTENTTWPDEANWNIWTSNIEYNEISGNVSTLESGEYSLLENSNPQFTELPSPAGNEVINKNISYDFLVTAPIEADDYTILTDEAGNSIATENIQQDLITTERVSINAEVDISLYGLIAEDGIDNIVTENDQVIVGEQAYASSYELQGSNIEYSHTFNIKSIPKTAEKINSLIRSLEDSTLLKVYRSVSFNPTIWIEIDPRSRIWTYLDNKSFASDDNKLHDGKYWQKYSYRIRCALPYDEWGHDYLRFVHPAGLKLFSAILYEFASQSRWIEDINYEVVDPEKNYAWLRAYSPPLPGYHTPHRQPGWLSGNDRLLTIILEVLKDLDVPENLIRDVLLSLQVYMQNINPPSKSNRDDYQTWLKYLDLNELICGIFDKKIEDARQEWSEINRHIFSAISSFVSIVTKDKTYYPWFYSELIEITEAYENVDALYNEATIEQFLIDMQPYQNSATLEKTILPPHRHPLVSEELEEFTTEDTNFNFIAEGLTELWSATLVANKTNVYENQSVRFYASTQNIPNDTELFWNINSNDITPNSGSCIVENGVCFFRVETPQIEDNFIPFTFVAKLRQGSSTGPVIATSQVISCIEPQYVLTSSSNTTIEGGGIDYTLSTTGINDNTRFYYSLKNSSDQVINDGVFKIQSNNATFTIVASPNELDAETQEECNLTVYLENYTGQVIDDTATLTILDANILWTFNANDSALTNFSITTQSNLPIDIGWSDGSAFETAQSIDAISHTYTI